MTGTHAEGRTAMESKNLLLDTGMQRNIESEVALLKAGQVALSLGISRSLAYAMMATGRLPVVRIGRAVRVPKSALAEWVKRNTDLTSEAAK